jgi:polygalacturonase
MIDTRRAVAVVGLVGLVGLGILTVRPEQTPPSPESPATPALPDVPRQALSSPVARPVAQVPHSIDATGATDVTAALQAFIDSVPDGSGIRLAPGGRYRVDGILRVESRRELDLDGAGATIEAKAIVDTNRRNLYLVESDMIAIHDLTIRGANPEPGVLDEAHQFEHGIWIDSSSDIKIDRVTIENPRGDCVYLGTRDGTLPWTQRVSVRDVVCRGAGRNGIAIVGANDVLIEDSTFENLGLHAIDIEPNRTDGHDGSELRPVQGATRVAVIENRIVGPITGYFFAANGWGRVDDLSVLDNVLVGTGLRITVEPLEESGYIRSRVLVRGNASDTAYAAGLKGAAMRFARNVDLTVRNNYGPVSGTRAALIEVKDSCRIDIGDNTSSPTVVEMRGRAGECPVEDSPTGN